MKHTLDDINMLRHMVQSEVSPHLRHHFTAALEELAALRDRTTWRPIKEAPTGRDILLWSAADGVYIGDMFHGLVNNPTTHEDATPTHWLPLPEAPR